MASKVEANCCARVLATSHCRKSLTRPGFVCPARLAEGDDAA